MNAAANMKDVPYTRGPVSRGNTAYDPSNAVHEITFDTTKMERVLGMLRAELITMVQTAHDILGDFQQRGR